MARIKYSGLVDDIVGKVLGMTFQSNGAGTIIRKSPAGKKLGNTSQNAKKRPFGFLGNQFRVLSFADRANWNVEAEALAYETRFGVAKVLNGYQYFQLVNGLNLLVGNSINTVAPTPAYRGKVNAYSVVISSGTLKVIWAVAQTGANTRYFLFASPPTSFSGDNPRSVFRYIKSVQSSSLSEIDFGTEWNSVFGLDFNTDVNFSTANILVYVYRCDTTAMIPSLVRYGST